MSKLGQRLEPGERVLWTGKPVWKAYVLSSWATIPFGAVFLGFSIFWIIEAWSYRPSDAMVLFGFPFFVVGLTMTFGPTLLQFARYRNTEYMITAKRIIAQTGAIGIDTRFVNLDRLQEVSVSVGIIDRMCGTGTVYPMTAGYPGFSPDGGASGSRPSLRALKDPYQVQKLLQQAMEQPH